MRSFGPWRSSGLVLFTGYTEMSSLRPAAYRSLAMHIRCDGALRRKTYLKGLCSNLKLRNKINPEVGSGSWHATALLTTSKGIFTSTLLRQELSKTDRQTGPSTSTSPSPMILTKHPKAEGEVADKLIEELKLILARFPEATWLPISDLYNEIPMKMRREYVRPHRSLFQVLLKSQSALGIQLHPAGIYCARGEVTPDPSTKKTEKQVEPSPAVCTESPTKGEGVSPGKEKEPCARARPSRPLGPLSDAVLPASSTAPPRVDFYYDVGLTEIPPPPADFDVTPSSLPAAQSTEDGTVMSLRDFVPFIPPFFVPLDEVLAHMAGYTEEHILNYFNAKAMEMVQIADKKYIRLYGGYAHISLDGCEDAEEVFKEYKPKLEFLSAFVNAFEGIQEQWMPLRMLLRRADPAVVAQMNPGGPAAITYFAQMQHVFGFSVMGGNQGGDAEDEFSSHSSSVLLRKQPYTGLTCETSPTPKSVNFILQRVPLEGLVDVHTIQAQLTSSIREEVDAYYGDLVGLFKAHAPIFSIMEDHTVVMRTRYRQRMQLAALPLEEQLRISIANRDKRKVRAIRRRIAFRDNPSHPFHDPDNLAREVAKYLPQRGFVTLKSFLRTNIPEEVLSFMPAKMNNLFANYPQYFQRFEYQSAGTWCISRPGQPLPRGVIRQQFSEDDLLRLIAELMQRSGGTRTCGSIFLNIPHGAQEVIRKRHGGLYHFVEKYPQYFSIVLGSDTGNMKSCAVVHLVSLPNTLTPQRSEGTVGKPGDGLSDDAGGCAYHGNHSNDNEDEFDYN